MRINTSCFDLYMANRFKQIGGNRGYGILSKTYLLYNIKVSSLNFLRHTAQEGSRKTICRIVMSLYLVIVSRTCCVSIPIISLSGLTTNYMVCVIVCTGRLTFISPWFLRIFIRTPWKYRYILNIILPFHKEIALSSMCEIFIWESNY